MLVTKDGSARHAGKLADEQQGGQRTEDERRGVHSHEVNYSRRREQQACRDYWVSMYGADAELASRGGVTWID